MAKEALNTDVAWQHAETRGAILDAARRLLDGTGAANLSLDAVADATGFAHATIYAYFASRGDLLTSILCDDLAAFARGLKDDFPFSEPSETPPDEPALSVVASAPEPEGVPETETGEPEPEAAAEPLEIPQTKASDPEPEPEIAAAAIEEPLAEEAPEPAVADAAPESEIAGIRQAIARLEGRRVDAWLERRLRVFEKTLAELETRVASVEGASGRATGLVEESIKAFAERADALEKRQRDAGGDIAERLESADRKSRGTVAELRAALNDVYGRLETLEIAKGIAVTPAPSLDAQWEAGETTIAPAENTKPERPLTAAAETYLSAARRAAKTAAELAEMESGNSFLAAAKKSWTRTRLIVAGCIGVGVLMVVAGFVLHAAIPVHQGIVRPIPPVAMQPATVPKVRVAARLVAPLPHPDMAIYRLSALASTGNANAELLLGLRTLDGDGVSKDDAKAAQLLQQSAAQGNAIAQYWLGTLYERGRGVAADPAAAWRWYQSAAKKGNVKAMYNLAVADARGKGTKANPAQAAHWFWVAAMQGYLDAQYNLAVLYERGQGVPQSLINAYKWYAIAAAAGDTDSKTSVDALKTQLKPADLAAGAHAAAGYKPNAQDRAANDPPELSRQPAQQPGG
jgi:localization factor PodJL